jgi:glycosyltransferase involved in cell wall biosynthesis
MVVAMARRRLSVVVVAYNMARELPRTVRSLSPDMQRGMSREDYEIIVVDNGSTRPFSRDECTRWGADVRFLEARAPSASPASAMNAGLASAEGELVGAMIDGARLASPGLLAGALLAARVHHRPVIASLGFHLGPDFQPMSTSHGYDQTAEDRLLEEAAWTTDGYRLFDISVFAGSSRGGWFSPMAESNALFLPRDLWRELEGYDERFVQPGGGLVNLDTYDRACALPDSHLVVLLGEGTFHQVHGGIATNASSSDLPVRLEAFHAEYRRIRGRAISTPTAEPLYLGRVPPQALASIARSARARADLYFPTGTG